MHRQRHVSSHSPNGDTKISTCRGSASRSHRSPPSAPGGDSLNSLFGWIVSCTSPISTLGPITAVVLTNKCFPDSSRNALQSDLRPLKEKSSPQRTSLTNVSITFRYPTQMLNLPSDTPINLSIKRCSRISRTVHCFQHLVDYAVNGHEHSSRKR